MGSKDLAVSLVGGDHEVLGDGSLLSTPLLSSGKPTARKTAEQDRSSKCKHIFRMHDAS